MYLGTFRFLKYCNKLSKTTSQVLLVHTSKQNMHSDKPVPQTNQMENSNQHESHLDLTMQLTLWMSETSSPWSLHSNTHHQLFTKWLCVRPLRFFHDPQTWTQRPSELQNRFRWPCTIVTDRQPINTTIKPPKPTCVANIAQCSWPVKQPCPMTCRDSYVLWKTNEPTSFFPTKILAQNKIFKQLLT